MRLSVYTSYALMLLTTSCATVDKKTPYVPNLNEPTAKASFTPSRGEIAQGFFYLYLKEKNGCFRKYEITTPENMKLNGIYETQIPLNQDLYFVYIENIKNKKVNINMKFVAEEGVEYSFFSYQWLDMRVHARRNSNEGKIQIQTERHDADKQKQC